MSISRLTKLVLFFAACLICFSPLGWAESDSSAKLQAAMSMMKDDSAKLGAAKAEGVNLFFGSTKINGNYQIVDAVKEKLGCTATFFVKKGDSYIRVSTNVLKEGNRAVGTPLDPNGKAIVAINKGEVFAGVVDILGAPYDTIYEPIKDSAGQTVGVYYVGFPLNK